MTNLTAFSGKMTALVDKGTAVDVVPCLALQQGFCQIFPQHPNTEIIEIRLDKQMITQVEKCLDHWTWWIRGYIVQH